jgi:hypothetical protein
VSDSFNPWTREARGCFAAARLAQMAAIRAIAFFARFLFPRRAAVSAGSARCTVAPRRRSSSTTNRQPVVASSATSNS